MKKGMIVMAALLFGIQAMAQDVIYFSNGSQQKAKVSEVRLNEIVYKKAENPNGPTYTTNKSDVQMIEFSNGYKETFAAANNNNTNSGNNNTGNNYGYSSNTPQSYSNNGQPQSNQGSSTTNNNYYTAPPSRPNVNIQVAPPMYYGGGYGYGGYGGWGGYGGYYNRPYYGGWGWAGGGWGWGSGGYHHGGGWGGHHGGGHHHR